jgi:hypothetical protein
METYSGKYGDQIKSYIDNFLVAKQAEEKRSALKFQTQKGDVIPKLFPTSENTVRLHRSSKSILDFLNDSDMKSKFIKSLKIDATSSIKISINNQQNERAESPLMNSRWNIPVSIPRAEGISDEKKAAMIKMALHPTYAKYRNCFSKTAWNEAREAILT